MLISLDAKTQVFVQQLRRTRIEIARHMLLNLDETVDALVKRGDLDAANDHSYNHEHTRDQLMFNIEEYSNLLATNAPIQQEEMEVLRLFVDNVKDNEG